MAQTDSVGLVKTHTYTFAQPPDEMPLDSGEKLGPITLAYETYGELDADRGNAILITHALSGDAHVAGRHRADDRKPGWWEVMVGPGKAFDTEKYFIICSNVLGGCGGSTGPSSINPATNKPYGLDFPLVTIADMVRAQKALIAHLGIDSLLSVAGGSMGGMQVLDWAARYRDSVRSAMVIASTHRSGAQQIAFDAVGRHAIRADATFRGGDYYGNVANVEQGLAIARMLAHITYLSDESMRAKFGRTLRRTGAPRQDFDSEYAVETYLDYQGQQFVDRFDANSYLYITKAIDDFDIAAGHESLDEALQSIDAKVLVLAFSSDWLYPPYQSEEVAYALARDRKDVTYCNIQTDYGHDGFLLENESMTRAVSGFLEHVSRPGRVGLAPANGEAPEAEDRGSSAYGRTRFDYDLIVDLVDAGSHVLDVGCGDGELMARLIRERNVSGTGIEVSEAHLVKAIERGVSVIQADVDKGLQAFPDNCFDYALLSMTFQVIAEPRLVLREMLRVANKCILSFPNFGHWRVRSNVFFGGRSPITKGLPYTWDQTPNRHFFSIKDFRNFCQELGVTIEQELPFGERSRVRILPNVFAEDALYVLSTNSGT